MRTFGRDVWFCCPSCSSSLSVPRNSPNRSTSSSPTATSSTARVPRGIRATWAFATGRSRPSEISRVRPQSERSMRTATWSRPASSTCWASRRSTILVEPRLPSKIYQGITTEITGEGGSIAPQNDAIIAADKTTYEHLKITPDWRTFRQYFARLEKQGMGINLASYVGATQVRRVVLGDADVQPTPAQLEQMKSLVRDAMHDGAIGVSTSLEYAPAPYAKTEEIIALAAEASKIRRHLRDSHAQRRATPSTPPSTRLSASARKRTSRWRSGISKWPAKRIGTRCPRSSQRSMRPVRRASM